MGGGYGRWVTRQAPPQSLGAQTQPSGPAAPPPSTYTSTYILSLTHTRMHSHQAYACRVAGMLRGLHAPSICMQSCRHAERPARTLYMHAELQTC